MRPPAARAASPLRLLALLATLHSVWASGVFELQILEFTNYRLQLASGACCGGGARPAAGAAGAAGPGSGTAGGGGCGAPCRTRFALCLKEYQSAAAPGACSFGRAASPALGTDSFTLAEPLYTLALPFTFRWTRSFTLILQAYDDYNYTDPEESGLIAEVWWSGIVEPGAAWHALRGEARAAAAAYRVRVLCQPNYYNSTCTTFCRARDDQFGHYTCSGAGDKRCLPGWRGDNCDIPVCAEGCHPVHGRCDRPGDCDCRPGWRGALCAQCTPYPGCKHGYCNGSSWDCTCDTNWGGILCDQDLNYCGTHEPCQHGGTCENTAPDQYLCTCAEGFSGPNCERVDHPCAPRPCRHGVCRLAPAAAPPAAAAPAAAALAADAAPDAAAPMPGFVCDCSAGWAGPLCDQDIDECASSPCQHGATCRDLVDGYECECAPGWSGPACTDDVDECAGGLGPCVNAAACTNAPGGFSCACLAGWTGATCAANVDDCAGQCLYGATCIDLVNDFHCACAPGYAGRTCAHDVDECASRPCRHGGECVDLLDAYRCICPVGFSGRDCELPPCYGRYCQDDRDHCAGAPCGNGAACYTAQSDYYCHCPRGWTGKNCTTPAAAAAAAAVAAAVCPPCAHGRCRAGRCLCEPGFGGPACADRVECSEAEGEVAWATWASCGAGGVCVGGGCVCRAGWSGPRCEIELDECSSSPCRNNATCVDGVADFACLCPDGWTGKTCDTPAAQISWCGEGTCLNGGSCAAGAGGDWACACRGGWAGARCERAADACAAQPCLRGGRCVPRAGWYTCECPAGWGGARCEEPAPPAAPSAPTVPAACAACPRAAVCALDPQRGSHRCLCPPPTARSSRRCLELVAGLGDVAEEDSEGEDRLEGRSEDAERGAEGEEGAAGAGRACSGDNGTWWWGCNTCWCSRGAAQCTRLWCGLADCLAPGAPACRADEVCVPAAPALCLRAPCAAPGECRRVAGRRVEPPPLPAPPACWPAAAADPPEGCARARLELARERLGRGAHAERACSALRRALAVQLVPRTTPLALLCDLATDDEDALDLAMWVGPEEGAEGAAALAAAVRALAELVSRRRLAAHPLLGAALRLRLPPPSPAAREPPPAPAPAPLVPLLATAAVVIALCVGALLLYRRRRAVAAERRRRDEDKSNNLQNEENLRRYANPLRDEPEGGAGAGAGVGGAGGAGAGDELPRALYKAQNADARNTAPPRPADKECTKRALGPGLGTGAEGPRRAPPPERLTVLV